MTTTTTTTTTPLGRHFHSFGTIPLLLAFAVLSSYVLTIDAFQPHRHSHSVTTLSTVDKRSHSSDTSLLPALPPYAYIPSTSSRRFPAGKHYATPDDSSVNSNEDDTKDHLSLSTSSPSSVSKAYTVGQYLFLLTAALHLFTARPSAIFLESEFARSTEWGAAAGFGVAAGVSYILKGAQDQDRLSSDTYKRLSVGLLGFCLLGLAAVPGEAAFVAIPGPAAVIFTVFVKMYGTVLGFASWKQGVVGAGSNSDTDDKNNQALPRKMLQELGTGILETVKGLRVQNAKKALFYRNGLLLVVAGMVSNFMEGIFNLRYQQALNRTWLDASLQWSAVARLFLISTMIYSLKDAAERDRLTGTTFIQLNRLTGAWAVTVAAGQSLTIASGVAVSRGIEMAAFGTLFFLKGWKSVREKAAKKASSE